MTYLCSRAEHEVPIRWAWPTERYCARSVDLRSWDSSMSSWRTVGPPIRRTPRTVLVSLLSVDSTDRSLLFLSAGSLIAAGVLLLRPTSQSENLWAVTVGTRMAGFSPAEPEPLGSFRAFLTDWPVMNRGAKGQLAVGLLAAGIGIGSGFALISRRASG